MATRAGLVLILVLATSLAGAAEITVDNVVQLKQLGFSDAEVKAEIDKSDAKYQLTPADIRKLKNAGVGDGLLSFMQGPQDKPLTIDRVVAMVEDRDPTETILQAIAESRTALELSPARALELTRKNVPQAILLALRAQPLGTAELQRLADTGLSEEGFTTLASITGFGNERPTAGQALELLQAGVPKAVVAMFREGRRPDRAEPSGAGVREYRHVGKQFVLRCPPNWRVLRSLSQGTVTWAATPERGKTKADDLDVCFEVGLLHVGDSLLAPDRTPVDNLKHLLPLLRHGEPKMKMEGDIAAAPLGKLPGAHVRFQGQLKDKTGTFITDIHLASRDDIHFMAISRAPADAFDSHQATFNQIRTDSDFGRTDSAVRNRPIDSSELLERYRRSVVSVLAHREKSQGSGTGFIIHPDGYVATNAHVVLDKEGNPARRYTVQWDSGLGLKELEAELIGWRFAQERMFFHWEADVALLKLPPGDYTATPLTPLDEVRLGDPVVAVGFPQRFTFDTLNIFITGGVVTRFNRDREGRIESIFTDAKIAKGSSGGPCFSRVTGGVIGQNTFSMPVQVEKDNQALNELVGYSGVIPVRYLKERFPLVADLGLGVDPELDFLDTYALAIFLLNHRPGDDARRLADRAVKLRPDSAAACFLQASCLLQNEGLAPALTAFNRAVQIDPDHMDSLLTLSRIHLANDNLVEASQFADRAVRAHPKNWRTHYTKAQLLMALGRNDDALRSASTAKSLARDVLAEPTILAAQIRYAQGDLDAGRRDFELAARIHPTNLTARLGVGEYFERKNNHVSALLEYGKLETDFPNNPIIMTRLARCYKQMKRYDKAWDGYFATLTRYKELGADPTEEIYFDIGDIAWNIKRDKRLAIPAYAEHLAYHGDSPRAYQVHLLLGDIFRDTGNEGAGIAYGHLCRARTLNPNAPEVREALEKRPLRPLSIPDMGAMLNQYKYHPTVVADIVMVTKLNILLDAENRQHIALLREHQIPTVVTRAILISNDRQGAAEALPGQAPPPEQPEPEQPDQPDQPQQPGNRRAPAQRPQPEPKQPPAPPVIGPPAAVEALVGTWKGKTNIAVLRYELTLTFTADGSYTIFHQGADAGGGHTTEGTFTTTGAEISMITNDGNRTDTPYQIAGNRLVLNRMLGYIRPVTFTKQ